MKNRPNDSEQFNIPDQGGVPNNNNEANEVISDCNTAEKNVKLTDEQVDAVKDDAAKTTAKTAGDADANMVDGIDSDTKGFKGKKVSNVFKSISGPAPMRAAAATPLLRGIVHPVGTDDEVRIADVDKLDRNLAMAESMYDSIQAEVIEEGVKGTSNSDEAIIGDPSDVNVYSEQTTIMAETVTRRTKKYGVLDSRHRSSGTEFHRNLFEVSVSGDYLDLEEDGSGNVVQDGHAYAKGKDQKENLLFNRLAADGGYIPNQFIMPKTGFYLLKGINPTPTASPIHRVGVIRRRIGDEYQLAEVYQATGNGIFEVEDVTPLVSDIISASRETAELLTCNKSKMQMGVAEQLANQLIELADKTDNRDLIMYPETNLYRNRCSLYQIRGINNYATALDCYNNIEQYIEFMTALSESEVEYMVPRLNVLNIKANLKQAKGFEGMQHRYQPNYDRTYYRNIAKAYPCNEELALPTLAAYINTMASPHRYNRPAALIYGMRELWAKIDAQCKLIDEGDLKTAILDKVFVANEVLEHLEAKLACGSFSDPTHVVSDARIEMSDVGYTILHFDPNDLVDYTAEFTGSGGSLRYRADVFPCAGYVNVYTGAGGYAAEVAVYNVCPTWIDTIARIISSNRAIQRLLNYRETTLVNGVKLNMLQYQYAQITAGNGCEFHPWLIDTYQPAWIAHWFLDGMMEVQHDVLSNKNQRSGYFRFLSMIDALSNPALFAEGKTSVGNVITSLINNDYIKADEFARTAADFKQLSPEIIAKKFDKMDDQQLAFADCLDMRAYNANWGAKDGIVILHPSKFDQHVSSLEGWDVLVPTTVGTVGTTEVNAGTIRQLLEQFETTAAAADDGLRFWPSDEYNGAYISSIDGSVRFQVLVFGHGSYDKDIPVLFRRHLSDNGAKTVLVGTDNADPNMLGFEDNPQHELYGYDDIQNMPVCDGYIMLKRVPDGFGYAGLDYDDAAAVADYMICPFINVGETSLDSSALVKKQAVKPRKALRSNFSDAKNTLYVDTASINPTTGVVTGDAIRGYQRDANNINEVKRYTCQPTLYGYKRIPALFDGFVKRLAANSGAPCVWLTSHSTEATAGVLNMPGFFAHQTFMYRPADFEWPDNDDGKFTYAGIAAAISYPVYLNARFAVNVPAASDWRWYNWQDLTAAGYEDSTAQFGFTSTLNQMCRSGHKPMLHEDLFVIPVLSNANINADDSHFNDTVGQNARYVVLEDNHNNKHARYYWDRFMRMFKNQLQQPESDHIRFAADHYLASLVQRPQYLYLGDVNGAKNPDILSELCYNDIRTYRTDKPIIRLNLAWNSIGMTKSLVHEQFK